MATYVSSKVYDQETAAGTRTTESATPQLGDFVACGMTNSVGTDSALSGGGMTWTLRRLQAGASAYIAVFEATSGTPAAGQLTHTTSDTGRDFCYVWVRPAANETYNAITGNSASDVSVTVDLSGLTATTAELIAFGHQAVDGVTFTVDSGWTMIRDVQTDDPTANAEGICAQYRASDDAEWICDPSGSGVTSAVVVEMVAAASTVGPFGGLAGRGGLVGPGGLVGLGGGLAG